MSAQLIAVCVGGVGPILIQDPYDQGRLIREMSGIHKTVVSSLSDPAAVPCKRLGLAGDEQADLSVHGGPSKAVYCYPAEHYDFWKLHAPAHKQPDPVYGWAGENLCVAGLDEHHIWIGDQLVFGDASDTDCAILTVTAPRSPCYKFNHQMGMNTAAKLMVKHARCGWYLSVTQEGLISAGQAITVTPGAREISVAQQNHLMAKP
jgi:MOSC domain-containing protein YiiM